MAEKNKNGRSGSREEWKERRYAALPERNASFTTVSGRAIEPLHTPEDIPRLSHENDLGFPGEFPFTRGVHSNMYRGRLWTMRQFAGFGTARDTNERYHFLLNNGQTGLSVAFHLPTIMGRDSDSPYSRGEVGKCGVAIDSLRDMEILFDGIPLDRVTTSMTINAPASVLLALYIAVAEKQGVPSTAIGGTIQNDILKEYIAQKSWIYPPGPSMRLITDVFEYCAENVPRWNTISISGYHIREAGSTAAQELAFTLMDGLTYVEYGRKAGLDVDEFAPRLSFFFNAHNDLFEEVAKYRAARRIWAREMERRFSPKNPRSLMLRFHTQTAGCSLTAQQPMNNIVRTTIQALAAVLGGTQSLHTNSMDETLALPSEQAVTVALRTQQILAAESGAVNTIDPLAGSYFVESLTDRLEEETLEYFRKIEDLGGMVAAIERGFPQGEIMDAAFAYQQAIDAKDKIIVGVNEYSIEDEPELEILKIGGEVEAEQIEALGRLREERDSGRVDAALSNLKGAAAGSDNTMPFILDAVRAYATVGEICDAFREVFGEYDEPIVF